jgi:oligopeptidase B
MGGEQRVERLIGDVIQGRLSRRAALRRAAALGVGLPSALALVARATAARQESTPRATPAEVPQAPVAEQIPSSREFSGVTVEDPYAWLENPDDPKVIAYLEAENAYADAMMAPTAPLQETLYNEMLGRIQETDVSVPIRIDDFFYYTRTEEGLDYEILCRRQGSMDAPEEVLLDLNQMVDEYIALGDYEPSPDHRYLAYSLNETGGIEYTLYVLDTETGQLLPEVFDYTETFAWANDDRTLFYTTQDEQTLRGFELYRHVLGTDPVDDELLYREDDEIYWLYLYKSNSRRYVFAVSYAYTASEARFLDADRPDAAPVLIEPRRDGVEYYPDHHDDRFLLLTNDDAVNFRLAVAPLAAPGRANWTDLLPATEGRLYEGADVLADYLAVYGRQDGFSQAWIYAFADDSLRQLEWDEAVYTVGAGDNLTFDATTVQVTYTSLVTPYTVYEVDLATGEKTLLKQETVVGGHDPANYVSERLFATAGDGTQVPISLVCRKDKKTAGPMPLRLDGYGAYGLTYDPEFAPNRLSVIDRGMIYAIAHVRGGSELGRPWYDAGKLLKKKNTFTDFIASAEHLIAEGRTTADRIVAYGGSAGGLLTGAVANMRPDLFGGIVTEVPFVDVLRVMLDPTQPLTTGEYVEWGNPAEPEYYDYIRSYSPYDNIAAQAYPHIFSTGGLNDDQVPYWQPAKWTAKLRANKTDDNLLLLKTNMGAGHGGDSGRYDQLREIAFLYAFFLRSVGMA